MERRIEDSIAPTPDHTPTELDSNDLHPFFESLQEYCTLSKIMSPSEQELDRLAEILEMAQQDSRLSCLLNEADHLIAHELGLVTDLPEHDASVQRILSYSLGITD